MQNKFASVNLLIITSLFGLNFSLSTSAYAHVKSRIVLVSGGNQITRNNIAKALTAVLQEANKMQEGKGNPESIRPYCSETGFKAFQDLVNNTGFFSTLVEQRTNLLETVTDHYEVRDIKVRVKLGETAGDSLQELVFIINFRLYIENIHFALETHHYQRLIEEGKKLDDMVYRQQILDFVEEYRTAHNRKDIAFLERAYSDNALIIIGQVVQIKEGESDYMSRSTLGDSLIQFVRLSKREYLDRLRRVFQKNSFVRVIFDDIEIVQDSRSPEIYGIQVKQKWNSSTYSDVGYLFVMIDFNDKRRPLIHVRAWQPQKFADGSVIGLGDFEIIK